MRERVNFECGKLAKMICFAWSSEAVRRACESSFAGEFGGINVHTFTAKFTDGFWGRFWAVLGPKNGQKRAFVNVMQLLRVVVINLENEFALSVASCLTSVNFEKGQCSLKFTRSLRVDRMF